MKPPKITEQEHELEFPSVEQYKGQFISDMEFWESVLNEFPENTQFEIEGILYRLEQDDEINTRLLRQLATLFRGNATEEHGQRIAKWIDTMADFADFFGESLDILIDSALGEIEDGEDVENGEEEEEPEETAENKK